MKATIGFLFFLLFLAGFALSSLLGEDRPGTLEHPHSSLAGTAWRVSGMQEALAGRSDAATLHFDPNGRVFGNSGCNTFNGRYEYVDGDFRVVSLRATRNTCVEALAERERELFEALRAARQILLVDGQMQLAGADGEPIADFAAEKDGN